jgi:hypothetical protein
VLAYFLGKKRQDVRAASSEILLEGVQALINQRMPELATNMDVTLDRPLQPFGVIGKANRIGPVGV